MRTHGQPSGQLFPKGWPLSSQNQTKSIINKQKVNRNRNSDTKATENHKNYRFGTVSNELLEAGAYTSFMGPTSSTVSEVVQNIYLFVCVGAYRSSQQFLVMSGRSYRFLGITSTFRGVNVSLLKDTTRRR